MAHNTRQISLNQLTTLIIIFLIGGSTLSSTARYSGQNIWIVVLISGFLGAILFTIYHRISKVHNYQGFPNILKSTFGSFLGTIMLLFYAGFFLFRTMAVGNYMTAMAQETLMYGANQRLVIAMLLVTLIITILYGLNVIARSSEIFLFIIIFCMVPFLLAIFTSNVFNTENLVPILAHGLPGISQDLVRTTFLPFGELFVFLMLFTYVAPKEHKGILKRSYIAIIVSALIMIAIDLTTVALLGSTLTANFEYSFYNAMQLVGIQGFLERLDPLAIVIIMTGEYFKLVIYLYATVLAIQSLNKKFNFKITLFLISILLFFLSPLVHLQENGIRMETSTIQVLAIFVLAIPLIIWIASEIQFKKKKKNNLQKSETSPEPT